MRIIREPLFHFLLLGAAIFALYGVATRHKTDKPGQILVTQGTIENLVTGFTRTWQRPPTEEELQGLLRDYIREEVAYREALALGLDRDDTIVRRRLRQKLEFLSEDVASRSQPGDAELQAFLLAHPELFRSESLFSFRQIYLNPQLHGAHINRDAASLLAELRRSGPRTSLTSLGDPFLLEAKFENIPLSDVNKTFGEKFALALSGVPSGVWQGPVASGYGAHLVFVMHRSDGHLPVLADVREQVRRAWLDARRNEAMEKFYQALLRGYKVKIEPAEEKKVAQVR